MGVAQNSLLGAGAAIGVAANKLAIGVSQNVNEAKSKKEKEANAKKAAADEAKRAAIDEVNLNAELEGTELEDQILKRKQNENAFAQGLAREGAFFAKGSEKKKKLTNLEALQRSKQALSDEVAANNIRMNQIRTVMQLKGYGGRK